MKFRTFLEEVPDSFMAHDMTGRIVDANRKACESLGYTREELFGMTLSDIELDHDPEVSRGIWADVMPDRSIHLFGWHRRKDGTAFPVEVHLGAHIENGAKTILLLAHDITGRSQAQSREDRLSKLYRALSEVNQAIVRMDEEAKLFPLVCRMAVDFGGMKMAWVGVMNEASGRIQPVASYGGGTDYLQGIVISGRESEPEGRGPSGVAYRENRCVIANDLVRSGLMEPWLESAIRHGFESCGSFPIYRSGLPFAVFTVYHELSNAFDPEIIGLLDEMARDISFSLDNFDRERVRRQTQEALLASERHFRAYFERAMVGMAATSADMRWLEVNDAMCDILGYSREELMRMTWAELTHPEDIAANLEKYNRILRGESDGHVIENRFVRKDGRIVHAHRAARALRKADGSLDYVVAIVEDITERKLAMETIREQNNFLNAVFESEPHCVKVVAPDGKLIQMNRAGLSMLELDSLEEAQKLGLMEFILPQYRKPFADFHRKVCAGSGGMLEFPIIGKKGTHRWLESHATPLKDADGRIVGLLGVMRDVTEKKRSDELIWRQANLDMLTGLPNRYMFHDRLEQEIRRARRDGEGLAVFFIDLDQFKEVNDTLGHLAGDLLLMEAARRIVGCVGESDTVGRLGGDEFTVILSHYDMMHIEKIAQDILDRLSKPFFLEREQKIYVSASIGITLYPADGDGVEQLLKNADQALYAAKSAGRNRFSYFTASLQENAQSRVRLLNDLRGGLEANQFMLHFQPIVNLSTGRIEKAEALLRWNHPVRGMVGPMEFIPLAEETGLILPIGDWVFREAARWASLWTGICPDLKIGVNMSPLQFRSDRADSWLDHLHELGLSGKSLVIEITESLLLDADMVVTNRLIAFRDSDIQVAIDDFGTGYSALSYLKKFDIDYLKIDQSFIRSLEVDPSDRVLCDAIIVMAHKLGLKVIAEGVETSGQRDLLLAAGCDYAQGYLFSKPVPAEEFGECLKAD